MYFHHISFTYTAHRHSNPSTLPLIDIQKSGTLPPIDIQIPAHCHPSTFKSKHIATHRHHILAVCIGCLSHDPRALSIRGDEGRNLGRQSRVGIYENGNRTTHLLKARNLLQTAITVGFFFSVSCSKSYRKASYRVLLFKVIFSDLQLQFCNDFDQENYTIYNIVCVARVSVEFSAFFSVSTSGNYDENEKKKTNKQRNGGRGRGAGGKRFLSLVPSYYPTPPSDPTPFFSFFFFFFFFFFFSPPSRFTHG